MADLSTARAVCLDFCSDAVTSPYPCTARDAPTSHRWPLRACSPSLLRDFCPRQPVFHCRCHLPSSASGEIPGRWISDLIDCHSLSPSGRIADHTMLPLNPWIAHNPIFAGEAGLPFQSQARNPPSHLCQTHPVSVAPNFVPDSVWSSTSISLASTVFSIV